MSDRLVQGPGRRDKECDRRALDNVAQREALADRGISSEYSNQGGERKNSDDAFGQYRCSGESAEQNSRSPPVQCVDPVPA